MVRKDYVMALDKIRNNFQANPEKKAPRITGLQIKIGLSQGLYFPTSPEIKISLKILFPQFLIASDLLSV